MTTENIPQNGESTTNTAEATLVRAPGNADTAQYKRDFGSVWEPSELEEWYFQSRIYKSLGGEAA